MFLTEDMNDTAFDTSAECEHGGDGVELLMNVNESWHAYTRAAIFAEAAARINLTEEEDQKAAAGEASAGWFEKVKGWFSAMIKKVQGWANSALTNLESLISKVTGLTARIEAAKKSAIRSAKVTSTVNLSPSVNILNVLGKAENDLKSGKTDLAEILKTARAELFHEKAVEQDVAVSWAIETLGDKGSMRKALFQMVKDLSAAATEGIKVAASAKSGGDDKITLRQKVGMLKDRVVASFQFMMMAVSYYRQTISAAKQAIASAAGNQKTAPASGGTAKNEGYNPLDAYLG